jgi:hypothetical protein
MYRRLFVVSGTFIAEFERKHEASKPPRLEECWQPLQVKIRFATIYAAIDKIRTLQNEAESLHARATSENNQVWLRALCPLILFSSAKFRCLKD